MNQRAPNGKPREFKRDKFKRSRKDEELDNSSWESVAPVRSSSEKSLAATASLQSGARAKFAEKTRSRSRDVLTTSLYSRQELGGKMRTTTSVSSCHVTPENSPGKLSQADGLRSEGLNKHRSNITYYKPKSSVSGLVDRSLPKSLHHEVARKNQGNHDNEDSRLFRILSRLNHEADRERQIITIRQLKDYFLNPDNNKAVNLNYYNITANFEDLLHTRLHSDTKQEVVQCLGTFGPVLDQDSEQFLDWIFSIYFSTTSEDVKILLLRVLLENLKNDKELMKLNQFITMIMTNSQVALENADQPDLLYAIVDVIMYIAKQYPPVFRNHFRDIVDILVGWHIDSSQSSCLTRYTSRALISFQQFWVADMSFSLTLLGQFLEDMEAYSEDLAQNKNHEIDESKGEDYPPDPDECLAKISSLVRVFMTVLKSLGSYASPNQSGGITFDFLIEGLKCLLNCAVFSMQHTYDEDLITTANQCACILLNHCQSYASSASEELKKYVSLMQNHPIENSSEDHLISLLQLMNQAIKELGTQLPVEYVQYVFGPDSLCQRLKFWPYQKVQQQLLSLQRSILGLKNVPLLEEAYRCLLLGLQANYSVLLGEDVVLVSPNLENKKNQIALSPQKAEVGVLSSLCALAEIGNAKHSIIGMWALKPSFFDLVANRLRPTDQILAEKYPSVHYAIIYTLYSHCSRHGHFISSSTLISQSLTPPILGTSSLTNNNSAPLLAGVSVVSPPSSGHLSAILILLTTVVKLNGAAYDSQLLCVRWMQEIVEVLQHHSAKICHTNEFFAFSNAILDSCFVPNTALSISACSSMQTLFKNAGSSLSEHILRRSYEACIIRFGSNNPQIRNSFTTLFALLPVNVAMSGFPRMVSKPNSWSHENQQTLSQDSDSSLISLHDIWLARHGYISRNATGEFSQQTFRKIMAYILLDQKPKEKDWLLHMYIACQQMDRQTRVEKLLGRVAKCSTGALWFWATWESAQHCVLYKLRTILGKPQETFTTIEAALKAYAWETKKITFTKGSDRHDNLLRVKLLLDFMEHLEKSMYNAYEGCAAALPSSPKNVRTFFRTNKATCLEWLSRIRLSVIKVSIRAGEYANAVHHGYLLLHEKIKSENTQTPEFERLLIHLVHALICLKCPEAILGLYIWCRDKVGWKLTWIKAAVDHADGRYESASHEYSCILNSLKSSSMLNSKLNRHLDESASQLCDETSLTKAFVQFGVQDNEPATTKSMEDYHPHVFLMQQASDCYRSLGSWNDVIKWNEMKNKLQSAQNGHEMQGFEEVLNMDYIRALSTFEDNLRGSPLGSSKTLLDFDSLEVPKTFVAPNRWELDVHQSWAEQSLVGAAADYFSKAKPNAVDVDLVTDRFQKVNQQLVSLLRVSSCSWPPFVAPRTAAMYLPAYACSAAFQKGRKISPAVLSENMKFDPPDLSLSALSSSLALTNAWQHVFAKEQNIRPQIASVSDFTLACARLARKQQNLKLAQKLLMRNAMAVAGSGLATLGSNSSYSIPLVEMLLIVDALPVSDKLLKVQREGAKLLYSSGNVIGAVEILMNSALSATKYMLSRTQQANELNIRAHECVAIGEQVAGTLLSLVKYVQQDSKCQSFFGTGNTTSVPALELLLKMPLDLGYPVKSLEISFQERLTDLHDATFEKDGVISDSEAAIGRLLQRSVFQCPQLAKAWSALAGWCYRWGRKAVDASSDGCIELLADEKNRILSLTPKDATSEEREAVIQVMSQLHGTPESDWEELGLDVYSDNIEITRLQLLTACPSLQNTEALNQLMEMWCRIVRRAYRYYEFAAKAYFQYLQLNAQDLSSEKSEDDNITATLRLLRLVVKHAAELRNVLEVELARTPTAPWRGIIPQLFSRLSHPEVYVQQSISDLLCRVAQASPHLIVFQAVVGSLTLKCGLTEDAELAVAQGLIQEQISDDVELPKVVSSLIGPDETLNSEDEDSDDNFKAEIMQNCFTALVDTLGRQDAATISQVKNLVHELRRITLLWDELWLGSLNLHHIEMNRRIQTLEDEILKVQSNVSLTKDEKLAVIKEKHSIFLKPTLFVLEQLEAISSRPAETPHEQRFQNTFSKLISETVTSLREPSDASKPQQSWAVFRKLHQTLQQRVQQQTRSSIYLDQISPVLSALETTVIPMPGINSKMSSMVTIKSVNNTISILPTKTRPKKLAFQGSNGKKYTYLFKGLEDLHLDERIMQFLSIVNNMFNKSRRHGKALYNARHYSVTPLGPRSGLIEWVDGASPLFGLYKRWQQREVTAQALKNQNNHTGTSPTLQRPSEIYYNKLTPLLKEKDITNLENRKEWPVPILLQVLQELMAETPQDLLAKELWCSCTSSLEWWEVTQTYNHSTAVMSVIGYIIGLGDRHLDNVLVDLSTGEVVHIDYNVCFEKGKNLRVPEKVPFRMTPNIEVALGVTGIEGIFRVSCEHVLRVLRKGRETLLTLLEAFVYDPLVDWTPGNEGGYTGAVYGGGQVKSTETKHAKQEMELEIAQSMLAVRVAEMKAEWNKNKEELLSSFPKLENYLQLWVISQSNLHAAEFQLQDICHQRAVLEDALSNTNHLLYTLPSRFDEYSLVKGMLLGAQDAVTEKVSECRKWHNLHTAAIMAMSGPELGKWCAVVATEIPVDSLSVAPVVEFLQSAGQGHLVQQCEQSESELCEVLQQQRNSLRNCVELVRTYATIIMHYPADYRDNNRSYQWQCWLENLLQDFTVNKCQETIGQFHNKYGIESIDVASVQFSISLQFQLETQITDINNKLVNALDRQLMEGLNHPETLVGLLEQSKSVIKHYLKDNGDQGVASIQCVVISILSNLSKRLLMMENAAAAAGDSLVDLTAWSGDWFLDEICSTMHSITQLFGLVQQQNYNSSESDPVIQTVFAVYNVFNALEDLSLNFQTIILPEAIKTIQAKDPSMMELVDKLQGLIVRVGLPLDSLTEQLERCIRDIIMGMELNDNGLLHIVMLIRSEFNDLMQVDINTTDLSSGQMLYMGLNGLFAKLESDMSTLLNILDGLSIPAPWRKVDVVREAAALLPPVQMGATRAILQGILFLKKLQAVHQFFSLANKMAESLQIQFNRDHLLIGEAPLLTEEQLFKPIKIFIAEYVRKHVLGFPSQCVGHALCAVMGFLGTDVSAEIELRDIGAEGRVSLDELAKKPLEVSLRLNKLSAPLLTQAGSLVSNFDAAWRKEDLARKMEQNINQLKSTVHRLQLQLARHQWLYEDLLVRGNVISLQNWAPPSRVTVMSEMRKTVQALLSVETNVVSSQERYLSLTASIEQRMKWAAGANPSLASTQEDFELSITEKTSIVANSAQLSRELVNICNAILHFEALRTRTSEALSSDNCFLTLINKCQESCMLAESCNHQVTPMEEQLLNLLPLPMKGGVTSDWISKLLEKVSQLLSSNKEKLENEKMECFARWQVVKSHVNCIRNMLFIHHRLMSELRNILKSLAKHEEQGPGVEGQIHTYINRYKSFSEQVSKIVCDVLTDEKDPLESAQVESIMDQLKVLKQTTHNVYEGLLQLAGPVGNVAQGTGTAQSYKSGRSSVSENLDDPTAISLDSKTGQSKVTDALSGVSPTSQGQLRVLTIPQKREPVTRDPRTGKVVQERNTYATNVWKKVKMKLDGRDPDPNKRLTVSEQVDYIIKEATNLNNLSVLYEGWTPWV